MGFAIGRRLGAVPLTLGAFCTWIVALALIGMWVSTFGLVFNWLGDKGVSIPLRGVPDVSIHPFGFLKTLSRNVLRALSQAAALSERGMVKGFAAATEPFLLAAGIILALGLSLYELVQYVGHLGAKTVTRPEATATIKKAKAVASNAATITRAQFNALGHRVDVLAARVAHAATATAGAIASPFPRLGRVERDLSGLRARVKSLEKGLAAGVGAALLAKVIGKKMLGLLRCRKVRRGAEALCGMNPALFDALIGSTLLLTSAISIRELARELEEPTKLAADAMHKLIREF